MRRSLAQLERDFIDEIERDRRRRAQARREVAVRARKRRVARARKRGSLRFWLLVASLILTAVAVTAAMFETLYLLLG
jgi:hypothetical protein